MPRSRKPCKPGQERNPKTGRCRKISSKSKSPRRKSPKPCKSGQERNPKTGRCRKISSKSKSPRRKSPKPCKPGQERNPKTGRCRKTPNRSKSPKRKSKSPEYKSKSRSRSRGKRSLSPRRDGTLDLQPLFDDGVVVIKGPTDIHKILKHFHKQQIEFIDPATPNLIMGGFGAYGNPTSFHHPEIRQIRREVYEYLIPTFRKYFKGKNAEMLLDRFAKRAKGTQPTAESWHRDVTNSATKLDDDLILGGWINLDPPGSDPQSFSCVPGTHKDEYTQQGFARIDEKDIPDYKMRKQVYLVPPGHIIMFNQDIVHEVFPKKSKFDSYRLFCGWRITRGIVPLYDNSKVFEDQGLPQLGGGMLPPMYYNTHWMYPRLRENLVNFSNTVRPEFREDKELKTKNVVYNIVQRYMKSLKEAGLQLWPAYTSEEILMHTPRKL